MFLPLSGVCNNDAVQFHEQLHTHSTHLEERNEEIDMLMCQEEIFTNSVKCQELANEKETNNTELEKLYEKWEELAE